MTRQLLAAATLALAPAVASAQSGAPVRISVESPIDCTITGITDFGPVGTQGQTYTIDPTNPTGAQQTASFTCTGAAFATIVVSWAPVDLCHPTAGCMVFTPILSHYDDNYHPFSSVIASGGSAQLTASGNRYFWLGGEVTVNPGQATGLYSGIFTLVAAYQ